MTQRASYTELAPSGITAMRSLEHYVNTGTLLEPVLLELVRLRASLLNGCELCTGMHTHELQKHNETSERIAQVSDWRAFDGYTERERAALAWTEIITNIQEGHASDAAYAAVREHFEGSDLVNLTLAIVSINAWNRMGIAFRAEPNTGHAPTPHLPAAAEEQSVIDDDGGKVAED